MFRSATLRLTLYYMAIIMAISMLFSLVIYNTSVQSLNYSLHRQRAFFQTIPRYDNQPNYSSIPDQQLGEAEQKLQLNLILLNLVILFGAGAVSYLLAKQSLRPIEEALDAQSRFTADASHELRTPLTAMKTEIEVALRDSKLTKVEAEDLLRSNLEEISKLEALSNGLLKLAQQETGQMELQPVHLGRVVVDAASRVETLLKRNKLTFKQDVADDLTVLGEADSLIELLVILLDNAIKYSQPGTTISLTTRPRSGVAEIKVADQGQGIKASDIPHIFTRFYRADSSRSKDTVDGYGLGLSIAQKIAEHHHGSITVESVPGQGSIFIVTLPLVKKA